ncbi:MAG: tyrosine-type recombinase/integrase [Candidatus Dormibacteraceae bacterium]
MAPKTQLQIVQPRSSGLERLVADYLAHKRAAGNSPRSFALDANILERGFLPWCAREEVSKPEQLTQAVVDSWTAYLLNDHRTPKGQPLARESVRTYARTLGTFIRWAQTQDAIGLKVKATQPQRHRQLLETLDRKEISQMENAADSERDKLIIRLLADTGIRLGELLGMRRTDLVEQGRERYIKVRGKGSRDRLVPLQPSLFVRLRNYATRGRTTPAVERIFVTNRKSPKSREYEPLAPRSVQNMLHFNAKAAGVERKVHPHLFRHSYATWALRKGMNPLQLQRILGHADLTMISSVYSHLTATDSYDAMIALLRAEED